MLFLDCSAKGRDTIQMATYDPEFKHWVTSVLAQYPNLDLDNVCFSVRKDKGGWGMCGPWYGSNSYTILYPARMVQGVIKTTDRWSLLHELGHVQNHKKLSFLGNSYTKPNFLVEPMIGLCSVLALMCMKDDIVQDSVTAVIVSIPLLGLTTIVGTTFGYTLKNLLQRFDECCADTFACQQADKDALIQRYQQFKKDGQIYDYWHPNWIERTVHKMRTDFAHPGYYDRAAKCEKYLHKRFNIQVI